VVLESQHWNLGDFIGLGKWSVPAAIDLSALPASARLANLEPYLFFTPWTELKIFNRLGAAGLSPLIFPPLGSVGLSAAAIALQLGTGPVLVGGMDFSFSIDSSHARSTPGHCNKLNKQNRLASLLNAAALSNSVMQNTKNGGQALSNSVLLNYREIFEHEFAVNPRLFDVGRDGLSLGIKTLAETDYFSILEGSAGQQLENIKEINTDFSAVKHALSEFIYSETERLIKLRNILTGKTPANPGQSTELEKLIDECDYLWAHFPDYAETGGQRPSAEDFAAATAKAVSFLKRVRVEIDYALKIFRKYVIN